MSKFAVICRRPKECPARYACQAGFVADSPEDALAQAEEQARSAWGEVRGPACPKDKPVRLVVVAFPDDAESPVKRTGVVREYPIGGASA